MVISGFKKEITIIKEGEDKPLKVLKTSEWPYSKLMVIQSGYSNPG